MNSEKDACVSLTENGAPRLPHSSRFCRSNPCCKAGLGQRGKRLGWAGPGVARNLSVDSREKCIHVTEYRFSQKGSVRYDIILLILLFSYRRSEHSNKREGGGERKGRKPSCGTPSPPTPPTPPRPPTPHPRVCTHPSGQNGPARPYSPTTGPSHYALRPEGPYVPCTAMPHTQSSVNQPGQEE